MDLFDQLKRDEGLRLKPYTDTVGKVTIGYGRNLSDVGILPGEAEVMLKNDVEKVRHNLMAFSWYLNLDSVRQAAVENMAFNLGVVGLLHFPHLLQALDTQDWERASREALDSKWATQVGDRAQRIAKQLETGVWQ